VDHDEAEHLRREVRQLRQALSRWRAVAAVLAGVVAALLVAGGVAGLSLAKVWEDRRQEAGHLTQLEKAQAAAAWEASKARERDAATRRDVPGTVAGGLGLTALSQPDDGR
jgi:hypothetical protein